MIYHGHEGGKEERDAVIEFVKSLPQKYVHVLRYEFINQKNDPPFIIALEKMKKLPDLNKGRQFLYFIFLYFLVDFEIYSLNPKICIFNS